MANADTAASATGARACAVRAEAPAAAPHSGAASDELVFLGARNAAGRAGANRLPDRRARLVAGALVPGARALGRRHAHGRVLPLAGALCDRPARSAADPHRVAAGPDGDDARPLGAGGRVG